MQSRAAMVLQKLRERIAKVPAAKPRLPTVKMLAQEFHVSVMTLWKAVQVLKSEGVLHASRGAGLHVVTQTNEGETHPLGASSRLRWQKTLEAFTQDLLFGDLRRIEKLPSRDALCIRYGVSANTLRKVMENLESHRLIRKVGRHYLPLAYHASRRLRTPIRLIALGDKQGRIEYYNERMESFARTLESECESLDIEWEPIGFSPYDLTSFRKRLNQGDARGQIIWIDEWGPFTEPEDRRLSMLREALRQKTKTLIFDAMGDVAVPMLKKLQKHSKVFSSAGYLAGHAMGQTLLKLGHRKVVWIAPHLKAYWAQARLQGLQSAYKEAGMADNVWVLGIQEAPSQLGLALGLLDWTPDRYERVFRVKKTFESPDLAIDYFKHIKSMNLFGHVTPSRLKSAREAAVALSAAEKGRLVDAIPGLQYQALRLLSEKAIDLFLETVFAQALEYKASAWLCANDATALSAMKYLTNSKSAMKFNIAVAGFDNTQAAFAAQLTSYHFGFETIATRLLTELASAPYPQAIKPGLTATEIPGQVLLRQSTMSIKP